MGVFHGYEWDCYIDRSFLKPIFGNRKNYYRYKAERAHNIRERDILLMELGFY